MKLFKSKEVPQNIPVPKEESVRKGIMIVDDSKFSRNILRDILKNEGYLVVGEANDGLEAIDMAGKLRPEYIFMDVEMPKLDGLSAISRILQIDPDIQIIMCTAMGQKSIIVEAVKIGAKDYVLKPYKKENIKSVLTSQMEIKKNNQVIPFNAYKKQNTYEDHTDDINNNLSVVSNLNLQKNDIAEKDEKNHFKNNNLSKNNMMDEESAMANTEDAMKDKKTLNHEDIEEETRDEDTLEELKLEEETRDEDTLVGLELEEETRDEDTMVGLELEEETKDEETLEGLDLEEGTKDEETLVGLELEEETKDEETLEGLDLEEGTKDEETLEGLKLEEETKDEETLEGLKLEEETKDEETLEGLKLEEETKDEETLEGLDLEEGTKDEEALVGLELEEETKDEETKDEETPEGLTLEEGTKDEETGENAAQGAQLQEETTGEEGLESFQEEATDNKENLDISTGEELIEDDLEDEKLASEEGMKENTVTSVLSDEEAVHEITAEVQELTEAFTNETKVNEENTEATGANEGSGNAGDLNNMKENGTLGQDDASNVDDEFLDALKKSELIKDEENPQIYQMLERMGEANSEPYTIDYRFLWSNRYVQLKKDENHKKLANGRMFHEVFQTQGSSGYDISLEEKLNNSMMCGMIQSYINLDNRFQYDDYLLTDLATCPKETRVFSSSLLENQNTKMNLSMIAILKLSKKRTKRNLQLNGVKTSLYSALKQLVQEKGNRILYR